MYIDKTEQICRILDSGKYFFLSRPRRFGKSLLLSTLKHIFLGRSDLFQGLWIGEEGRHDWAPHPVLHFSFSSIDYKTQGLEKALMEVINEAATARGVVLRRTTLATRFQELIQALGNGPRQVVILIDEYDKPLTDFLEDLPKAQEHREIMKNFFSVVKDADPFIRFFLITGVSKFSKVSLFSDLNHLEDLTIHPYAATLTGYTQAELEHSFSEEIQQLTEEYQTDRATMIGKIRAWYNGYRWWGSETLYNPFSVLNFMKSHAFRNHWWESGTPTFLLKLLKQNQQYDFSRLRVSHVVFESFSIENHDWLALLFQTGYLTLAPYDLDDRVFGLIYPNLEVQEAMFQHLLAEYRHTPVTTIYPVWLRIKEALDEGNMTAFVEQVNVLFASIPYPIFESKQESFFHAVLHLTFQGIGLMTQSEVSSAHGRVDTVVHTQSGIYVMEFKLDASAQSALNQIRDKRYGSPYLGGEQPVKAVGISFSSKTREVAECLVRPYQELLLEN